MRNKSSRSDLEDFLADELWLRCVAVLCYVGVCLQIASIRDGDFLHSSLEQIASQSLKLSIADNWKKFDVLEFLRAPSGTFFCRVDMIFLSKHTHFLRRVTWQQQKSVDSELFQLNNCRHVTYFIWLWLSIRCSKEVWKTLFSSLNAKVNLRHPPEL